MQNLNFDARTICKTKEKHLHFLCKFQLYASVLSDEGFLVIFAFLVTL